MTLVKNNKYCIKYINGSGNISHRNITVISGCDPLYGKGYLKAWCHLRGEERTFRYDRILEAQLCGMPDSAVNSLSSSVLKCEVLPEASFNEKLKSSENNYSFGYGPGNASPDAAPSVSCTGSSYFKNDSSCGSLSSRFGHAVCLAITAAVLGAMGIGPLAEAFYPPEVNPYSADYSFIKPAPPVVKPLPAPLPQPMPLPPAPFPLTEKSFPGITDLNRFSAAEVTDPAVIKRKRIFRGNSGIISPALENIYESADKDHNGVLSWSEVEIFQNKIYKKYAYIANSLALRPDEFLQQGGGDCEDWALFTCGLLSYWDIESYVGSFGPESGTGHAVSLIPVDSPVENYIYYRLEGYDNFPDACYIPIDYNHVGSLSNAVDSEWNLRNIYIPSEIYGLFM